MTSESESGRIPLFEELKANGKRIKPTVQTSKATIRTKNEDAQNIIMEPISGSSIKLPEKVHSRVGLDEIMMTKPYILLAFLLLGGCQSIQPIHTEPVVLRTTIVPDRTQWKPGDEIKGMVLFSNPAPFKVVFPRGATPRVALLDVAGNEPPEQEPTYPCLRGDQLIEGDPLPPTVIAGGGVLTNWFFHFTAPSDLGGPILSNDQYLLVCSATALNEFVSSAPAKALIKIDHMDTAGATVYRVRKGDTLWSIAKSRLGYGNLWSSIVDMNRSRLTDPTRLRVGMELVLPPRNMMTQ